MSEVNLLWFDKLVKDNQEEFNESMDSELDNFLQWNQGVTDIFNNLDDEDAMEFVEKFRVRLLQNWIKSLNCYPVYSSDKGELICTK
jgi:hypothetical protein